jgi:hypothetical protein
VDPKLYVTDPDPQFTVKICSPARRRHEDVAPVPEQVELVAHAGAPVGHHSLHHRVEGKLTRLLLDLIIEKNSLESQIQGS